MVIKNMKRLVIVRFLMLLIMLLLAIGDDLLRVHQLGRNRESKLKHGFIAGSGGFLRKKSDGGVLLDRDRSLIGRNLAENHREQGRFASPIRPDQSDPIA